MSETEHDATGADELTAVVPEWDCRFCNKPENERVSREDGEWVHYPCGMKVPEDVAKRADERLAEGAGDYNFTGRFAEGLAGEIRPVLESAEASDSERKED